MIADYRLGAGMTGAAAVAAVRGRVGQPVPGIVITGDTEPQRIADAEASGCRLLHKPVDPERLAETIAELAAALASGRGT